METVEILRIIEGLAIVAGIVAFTLLSGKQRKEISERVNQYGVLMNNASRVAAKAAEMVEQVHGVVYNSKTATTQEKEKEE